MNIIRWRPRVENPWRDLVDIREEMNRLFDVSLFGDQPEEQGHWHPAVDVYEEKDKLLVKADLPGMAKKDVEISIEDGVLTVKGEKKEEKESTDGNCYRAERRFGLFQRSIRLPRGVDTAKAKAAFNDGVLTVTLPKTEEAGTRKIDISLD